MAAVTLSEIIEPQVFLDLPAVDGPEKTAFYESGIVTRSGLLDMITAREGETAQLPFWRDLDPDDAPNLSDDSATLASTSAISQARQAARKAFLNKAWAERSLVNEIAVGEDAMQRIRNRVDTYWRRQWQRRLIASLKGVIADNEANDAGDMVFDASTASAAADRLFTRANFNSARFTMGDRYDEIVALAVHSDVFRDMDDADDIDFEPDSAGQKRLAFYREHRVIVDDNLPTEVDSNYGTVYTSVLFAAGAVGWGEATLPDAVEPDRVPAAGNGGGEEQLWTRKKWLLHPFGFRQLDVTNPVTIPANGITYTLSELESAAIWDRILERKQIPMAFLKTLSSAST